MHIVPLSEQALAVLQVMKPISQHRPQVFPGYRNPLEPMNSQTANMALKRMGFKDILIAHGMRSIASSVLHEKGFQPTSLKQHWLTLIPMRSGELITVLSILSNEEK